MACGAGVPVDALLARFTPQEFDEVVAFRRIRMDPLERIAEILERGLAAVAAAAGFGADIEPDLLDPQPANNQQGNETIAGPAEVAGLVRSQC